MRKLLSTLAALVMCCALLIVPALAADTVDSGTCGENLTWILDGDGVLTISGTGAMWDYVNVFTENVDIQTVVIGEGVTTIGGNTFQCCYNLSSISLPSTLTSIGYGAFRQCESLAEITIPESVNFIGNYAFDSCSSLTEIVIPEGVTSIGIRAFADCYDLASVSLPSTLTTIGNNAFYWCSSLTEITIPEGVTSIGSYAFSDCYALASVSMPSTLTSIGRYAFAWCDALTEITIPAGVTEIGEQVFGWCELLTNISVAAGNQNYTSVDGVLFTKDMSTLVMYPSANRRITYDIPNGVTEIGSRAFYRCENLKTLTLPEGLTTIGDYGIAYCWNITSLDLPASLETIGVRGLACYGLEYITVAAGNQNYTSVDGVLFTKDMSALILYPCENTRSFYAVPEGVVALGDGAFNSPGYLEAITVPASLESLSRYSISYCYSLTSITVDQDNEYFTAQDNVLFTKDMTALVLYPSAKENSSYSIPSGVETIMTFAFNDARNLRSLTIPEGVTSVESNAFEGCSSLVMIVFPESLTNLDRDAIDNCAKLTTVYFPAGLTEINDQYFWNCDELSDIYFGGSEEQWAALTQYSWVDAPYGATLHYNAEAPEIPVFVDTTWTLEDGVLTITGAGQMKDYDYNGAPWSEYVNEITKVVLDDRFTSIGDYAFCRCYNLTEITIPKGVTSIGEEAFAECESLATLTLPESLETLGDWSLSNCWNLTKLHIPANLSEIGYAAFWHCYNLTEFTVDENSEYYTSVDGILFDTDLSTLIAYPSNKAGTSYTIPDEVYEVRVGAFYFVRNLQTVNVPANVEELGYRPFYWDESLISINVDEANEYYTSVDGILYDKDMTILFHVPSHTAKTNYVIPASVTTIEDAAICSNYTVTTLTLGSGVNDIGNQSVDYCYALTAIKVSTSNQTYAGKGGVLFTKDLSTLIRYPMGKTDESYTVPTGVVTIGEEAFYDNGFLTSVTISEGVTTISTYAFESCWNLTSVSLPSSLRTIGTGAFAYCNSLEAVTIPNGVSSIGQRAFYRCRAMTTVTLPDSLQYIGARAFSSCTALANVYYADNEEQWEIITNGVSNVLDNSDIITFNSTGPITKLTTPTLTVTVNATSGKPVISWTAVNNAANYEVWYCGTKNGTYKLLYTAKSDDFDVTHTGAKVGNDYFYKVCATNGDVKSDLSAAKGVWCDLSVPTVTVTNRASDGKPTISWTAVKGATGYEVWRCNSKNGTYTKLYTASATKLSVTHTGAAVGNDYFYKVKAIYGDNASCNSAFSAVKGVWVDLKAPTIKVVNSASSGKPVISWAKVDYATGYKVYCSTGSSTGTYKLIYTTTNPNKLSVTHIGAEAGEAYYYKVVATHKNAKCTSAYSAAKGAYCDLARPTLTVTLNSKGKPYLSWSEVEGADGYKVYRSTDNKTWTLMYTAKDNDFDVIHTGAKADTTYYYKVRAICDTTSKGDSAYSAVKLITME